MKTGVFLKLARCNNFAGNSQIFTFTFMNI